MHASARLLLGLVGEFDDERESALAVGSGVDNEGRTAQRLSGGLVSRSGRDDGINTRSAIRPFAGWQASAQIILVQNWFEELRRLVPTP